MALVIADFIMFQKIANILSVASFVLITTTLGGSYFGYKYLTSPQFQTKIMNKVLGEVRLMLPNVLDKSLPNRTGQSITLPKK
jgi:hypothetical protein